MIVSLLEVLPSLAVEEAGPPAGVNLQEQDLDPVNRCLSVRCLTVDAASCDVPSLAVEEVVLPAGCILQGYISYHPSVCLLRSAGRECIVSGIVCFDTLVYLILTLSLHIYRNLHS